MLNAVDVALYAGFMVYIAQNHPDIYKKIQGHVPNRVRVMLNDELGTNVGAYERIEAGIRTFMGALKTRQAVLEEPTLTPPDPRFLPSAA